MPAALCPAGEFPATTTLPRYSAGREDMVAVLLLFCGQAGQFLELTTTNRSSTRLLQDYFGWHGMLVDEANYGQIVRRAPCADGKCTTLASLSKQLPNSRINLMAIDATRDASPLPLLQTIDWSVGIDALVVKSRALSTSIAGAPVAAVARRAGLVALTARDHAWVGGRCSYDRTLRGGSTTCRVRLPTSCRLLATSGARRAQRCGGHRSTRSCRRRRYRISAVHGCASILSSDCRPPKSPPR